MEDNSDIDAAEEIKRKTMEDEEPRSSATTTKEATTTTTTRLALTRYLIALSIVYFVVIIVFFYIGGMPVGNLRLQDVLTMLNPLLLVPLFYRVAWIVDPTTALHAQQPSTMHSIIFLLGVVIYVHGDGMHLAANAINRYRDVIGDGDTKDVVTFYDEELGHYYPYAGLILLHTLCIIRQYHLPFREPFPGWSSRVGLVLAGFLHGFTLFISFIEGHFGIPGVVYFGTVVAFVVLQKQQLAHNPVYVFSGTYAAMGILLTIIWAVWQKGLPEFSEVGLI